MKQLVVAGSVAVVLSLVEYGTAWLAALHGLSEQSRRTGSLGAAKWLEEAGLSHRPVVALLGLATIVFLASLAWAAYRRRTRHLSLAGTGLAFLQGWLNPWYASWGASLLEAEESALTAVVASLVLSAIAMRDALPL